MLATLTLPPSWCLLLMHSSCTRHAGDVGVEFGEEKHAKVATNAQ